jgi:hypothetical protein
VQLGVVTDLHREVSQAVSLRSSRGRVELAGDKVLRDRELSPFIVNVENNGQLSASGKFRTQPSDLTALAEIHLDKAIDRWQLKPGEAIDVALYAHGGLVGVEGAADVAARWVPALYDAKILPVFIMWETDILSTLKNSLADHLPGEVSEAERRTAGVRDQLQRWWNDRLERTFARPGAFCWNEMKENAQKIPANPSGGLRQLYDEFTKREPMLKRPVRFHLIGHSAGAIVQSHLAANLVAAGRTIESVALMAPAVRCDTFARLVKPHIGSRVRRLASFLLDDETEQQDPTCKPLFGYGRSLLYLVSESFETERRHMPILGMQKYFEPAMGQSPAISLFVSPREKSRATTHGGFDDDRTTMESVVAFVKYGTA